MQIIALALLVFATRANGEPVVLRGATQGTTYHIKYVAKSNTPAPAILQADVEKLLAEVDRQMSTYRSDSELSRFNRAPAGKWFPVSRAVVEVVRAAREISDKTGGALDVTVGPFVRLWHFGPKKAESNKHDEFKLPTDAELSAARSHVGYKYLDARITPPALRKQVDGVEVDLSSIASGYTIDQLSKLFGDHGIENFMIEIGGEVRAVGKHTNGEPWKVAIERPLVGRRELQTVVPLVDAAITTAGGNRKFFEYAGRRYSHIIDPATGRPVDHSLGSVTVVADTCIEADGWDTPLLVLGPVRGFDCAEKNRIAAMFISTTGEKESVRATTAWQQRFGRGERPGRCTSRQDSIGPLAK